MTAWLASAGIVGIAVGFAAKDTLANLFSGVFIMADAPYKIGDYVVLSGLTAIHQFCSIGDYAFISGGSKVRKDVPPFVKAAKEPLSFIGVNSIGLNRNGFSSEKVQEIQNIYRILFQQNNNISQAIPIIEAEIKATKERDDILQFVLNSKRGLMKGYN